MDKQELAFFTEQARKDLLSFCVFSDRFYSIEPHHELINNALMEVLEWKTERLIISMPPRSGKSRIMQEFIAWVYWNYPKTDILYTGHSLSLLEWFSRNIMDRINSQEYKQVFDSKLSQWASSVKSWKIKNWWEFAIYGVGGGITWRGGNCLIIDDPYSSRQDAESETVRRTVSNWYWSTFLSRKQDDKASQIIIMQRWREDDLVWEILEREWDKWKVLAIPALNDNDESFWPSRFSADYFKEIRDNNPIFFSSQYQQDPVNKSGGDFIQEYFQKYEVLPQDLEIVTFVDPAISQKQEADNTAIVTVGLHRQSNNIYVLDTDYGHFLPDEIIDKVFQKNIEFRPQRIGIEVVQYQKMLALEMRKQMNERNAWFTLDEINPRWEKNARIRTVLQPRYSSKKIFHKWNAQLEQELLKFPNGKHDDIADALAGAVAMLDTYVLGSVQLPRMNSIYTPVWF